MLVFFVNLYLYAKGKQERKKNVMLKNGSDKKKVGNSNYK